MPNTLRTTLDDVTARARHLGLNAHAPGAREAILRSLIEALPLPALVADGSGRFTLTNRAAAVLTGYTVTELLRLSVWHLTPRLAEHESEVLWRAFLESGEQSGEFTLVCKDGRLVTAPYRARAHVLPACHLALLEPAPVVAPRPSSRPRNSRGDGLDNANVRDPTPDRHTS